MASVGVSHRMILNTSVTRAIANIMTDRITAPDIFRNFPMVERL